MRNYYFLASERINSIYNQLATSTPTEIVRKISDNKQVFTEGKLGVEGGVFGFVKGKGGLSGSENKERSFEENIRSTIKLEQKIDAIEKRLHFINVEEAISQNRIITGFPVHFNGAFYSKGLKNPGYYSSTEWDGATIPFLYKNVRGIKIRIPYSPLHFISSSAWANMKVGGKLKIDGIGFISNEDKEEITITPLGFGIFISDELASLLR